jgi:ABC-type sulfate transport system substrate-binding protein
MHPRLRGVLAGLASLLLAACVSTDNLQLSNAKGAHYEVTGRSYAQIWTAATIAMGTDMAIVESHRPSGVIKSSVVNGTRGKVVGFFIQPAHESAPRYTITIVSRWPLQAPHDSDGEPSVWADFKQALQGLR